MFTHFPNLSIVPVDNSVAEQAAFLRGKYGLRTPDAIVVASAIVSQAEVLVFVTYDLRLEQVEEIPCRLIHQI
ncbi:type II toxin-antitoxin system VapC family toxin [Paenibacillus sp. LHD-117]|uniref:type II toxin-antitoxin system VapC family toxin n=1 Tax=Paenibacillus sp. LHD-117 TaxID=3071412 RepID=UPI0035A846C8